MKRAGSTFPFEAERNRDLLNAFRLLFPQHKTTDLAFYQHIADMPSKRFWVTEERATLVILAMCRGFTISNMLSSKYEMYQEIYRRFLELRKQFPHTPTSTLVCEVVNQPAPKFYMTAKSVREIIYRIKRKWYEERKKKLRHLF